MAYDIIYDVNSQALAAVERVVEGGLGFGPLQGLILCQTHFFS